MDTRVYKGVMGDPLFEDLSSNNRARRISTQISFGHDHPLPPTWLAKQLAKPFYQNYHGIMIRIWPGDIAVYARTDWTFGTRRRGNNPGHLEVGIRCCCRQALPRQPFINATLIFDGLQTMLGWNSAFVKKKKKNGADPISDARRNDSQVILFHGLRYIAIDYIYDLF
jgi:hypothetical protein